MAETASAAWTVRKATLNDLADVVELDRQATGVEKPEYWRDLFERYVGAGRSRRIFLVAEAKAGLIGFVVGEIRAWEFGSPPCGWVFAINVAVDVREQKVGAGLLDAICARFRELGIDTVRTMLAREDRLNLSFFRSQGMRAGHHIQLEKKLA
jgi:N-acetylglutamate synthase-like GNAT family acetyltransferase